jgi:hypothetical protein
VVGGRSLLQEKTALISFRAGSVWSHVEELEYRITTGAVIDCPDVHAWFCPDGGCSGL